MGVYFHVITTSFPMGAIRAIDRTYPHHDHTGTLVHRRLDRGVESDWGPPGEGTGIREDVHHVVQRVCNVVQPHSLDVLRICAHGSSNASQPAILLGNGLTDSSVHAFEAIRPLWRIVYQPEQLRRHQRGALNYHAVIPRVELHVCNAALRQEAPLQALANAVQAPVFASYTVQRIHDPHNFVIQGALVRKEPVLQTAYR